MMHQLPWFITMGDDSGKLDAFAHIGTAHVCECSGEGNCHQSAGRILIGTSDDHDPKFCVVHYFEHCNGDGTQFDDYTLIPDTDQSGQGR